MEPEMRTPCHGRGLLRTGGKPGNRGGTGRPPCSIKAACRQGFAEALQSNITIAKGEQLPGHDTVPSHADMVRAFVALGRFGFAETDTIRPDQLVQAAGKVFAEQLAPGQLAQAIKALVKHLDECPEVTESAE